jgi:predicted ATPase/HPt (histidine-containing phosphotransfer) domain-containing protein/two-component sensor histidine kinase
MFAAAGLPLRPLFKAKFPKAACKGSLNITISWNIKKFIMLYKKEILLQTPTRLIDHKYDKILTFVIASSTRHPERSEGSLNHDRILHFVQDDGNAFRMTEIWYHAGEFAMLQLENYADCTLIYESPRTKVYHAVQEGSGVPVTIKTPASSHQLEQALLRYQHEAELLKNLRSEHTAGCLDLQLEKGVPYLILTEARGLTLAQLMSEKSFSMPEFLDLALALVSALSAIHASQVIHLDLNPANIFYDMQTKKCVLIDFDCAHTLSSKSSFNQFSELSLFRLAYVSPEQTGRLNRSVDGRSDLYSLGIILYEVLVGQVPFKGKDPLEIIHQHMAVAPQFPEEDRKTPLVIMNIILKLLSKAAEDRYQTAWGLKADIERCRASLSDNSHIDMFPIGRFDIPNKFSIPEKLYGREGEVTAIMDIFEKTRQGAGQLLLVSGYSGIGKTSLVKEVYRPITQARGYFIRGKYDQMHRDMPFSGLIQAFNELIKYLLSENEESLQRWKSEIMASLGSNAGVIAEVIPEIELIIGRTAPPERLEPQESQNRFNLVFINFIKTFCHASHPLVLFLDDLQWMDIASLDLMGRMVQDKSVGYLLIIGSYRDNEVGMLHPLRDLMKRLQKSGVPLHELTLRPLSEADIRSLLADALSRSSEDVASLATLVVKKTGGNPFFTEEFLKLLYKEQLLTFDENHHCWKWNIEFITMQKITDNIVDLMAGKIGKLPPRTQYVLQLAAAIGYEVELDKLALVAERTRRETADILKMAVEEGLLDPIGDGYKYIHYNLPTQMEQLSFTYRFSHDRIQQAAYSLIEAADIPHIHLKLARIFDRGNVAKEQIFNLVKHYNAAISLIRTPEEKAKIAAYNMMAARKAKGATAYHAAFTYVVTAQQLLPDNYWQTDYGTALEIYQELAELSFLLGDTTRTTAYAEEALAHGRRITDVVPIYETLIHAYMGTDINKSIEVALACLRQLGFRLKKNPGKGHVALGLLFTQLFIGNRDIASFIDYNKMQQDEALAATVILARMGAAAYLARPNLFPLTVFAGTRLGVRYGNSPRQAMSYAAYGLILCAALGKIEQGYQFGRLALDLLHKYPFKGLEARVYHIFHAFVQHFKDPLPLSVAGLDKAHLLALESGEIEFACHAANVSAFYSWFLVGDLREVKAKIEKYHTAIVHLNQTKLSIHTPYFIQAADQLMNGDPQPTVLKGKYFDEVRDLPLLEAESDKSAALFFYLAKGMLCYQFGQFFGGLAAVRKAQQYAESGIGSYGLTLLPFYESLLLLAAAEKSPFHRRAGVLCKVKINQQKMKRWARHAPANHRHKYLFVAAELAVYTRHYGRAMTLYGEAIRAATASEFDNERALIYERAAHCLLTLGNEQLAATYVGNALQFYKKQGNKAKLDDLRRSFTSQLKEGASQVHEDSGGDTVYVENDAIDLAALRKALASIAEERDHYKMAKRIVDSAIEFAGAQHGCLLTLSAPSVLKIEAFSSLDKSRLENFEIAETAVNYVMRTLSCLVIDNAQKENQLVPGLNNDPSILKHRTKSLFCMPIMIGGGDAGELVAILYLENDSMSGAFTTSRIEIPEMIATAAASRLEIARRASDMEAILANIKQGILTIMPGGVAHSEFSRHLTTILGTQKIAGANVGELLFKNSRMTDERIHLIKTFLDCTVGEPSISFALNKSLLVHEIEFVADGGTRILELDWDPIVNKYDTIEKVMLTLRDVTELRKLQSETAHHQRELTLIGQLLNVTPETYQRYVRSFKGYFEKSLSLARVRSENSPESVEHIFRNVHTIKGEARSLGFTFISDHAHAVEKVLQKLRMNPHSQTDWLELTYALQRLEVQAAAYDKIVGGQLRAIFGDGESTYVIDRPTLGKLRDDRVASEDRIREFLLSIEHVSGDKLISEVTGIIHQTALNVKKPVPRLQAHIDPALYFKKEKIALLTSILTHLVSNSLDHGLEMPEERQSKGKTAEGTIVMNLTKQNGFVVLDFSDDGRGLDLMHIKQAFCKNGSLHEALAVDESPEAIANLIFTHGFSTKSAVDQVSGRGVGLDAVRRFVEKEGGAIQLVLTEEIGPHHYKFAFHFSLPLEGLVVLDEVA